FVGHVNTLQIDVAFARIDAKGVAGIELQRELVIGDGLGGDGDHTAFLWRSVGRGRTACRQDGGREGWEDDGTDHGNLQGGRVAFARVVRVKARGVPRTSPAESAARVVRLVPSVQRIAAPAMCMQSVARRIGSPFRSSLAAWGSVCPRSR